MKPDEHISTGRFGWLAKLTGCLSCFSIDEEAFLKDDFPDIYSKWIVHRIIKENKLCYLPTWDYSSRHLVNAGADSNQVKQLSLFFDKHRIVKPRNCVLALGIPLSMDEYGKGSSDYAGGDTKEEYEEFINYALIPNLKKIKACGSKIQGTVSFSDFKSLLREKHRVILFFSHWILNKENDNFKGGKLEFLDGHISVVEVAKAILDSGFLGTLDLGVCHADELIWYMNRYEKQGYAIPSFRYLRSWSAKAVGSLKYYIDVLKELKFKKINYHSAIYTVLKLYQNNRAYYENRR
jgi:hypothetical protein